MNKKLVCPHCDAVLGKENFEETVAYSIELTYEAGVIVRQGVKMPLNILNDSENRYMCMTCCEGFKKFKGGSDNE